VKLYLHSWYLNILMSLPFWESMEKQVPSLLESVFGDAVKEAQFYDDYGLRTHTYAFCDGDFYYYPLSVVMKKKYVARYGRCRLVWLRWNKQDLKGSYDKDNPFATVEPVPLCVASDPPAPFLEVMANRASVYYERSAGKLRCTLSTRRCGEWGNVAQSFLDVFGSQITERLQELAPQNCLTTHWRLRTCVYQETTVQDGWRYRRMDLLNPHAEALRFAVKWQEPVDLTDDITDCDIRVNIAEDGFFPDTQPVSLLKQFLTDGTYVFSGLCQSPPPDDTGLAPSLQKILTCEVVFDASWPDVVCELEFSSCPDLTEITALFAKFNKTYNQWHREPVHYIGDPVADGNTVRIPMDFGGAEPKALEQLAARIQKAKWPLTKIIFS